MIDRVGTDHCFARCPKRASRRTKASHAVAPRQRRDQKHKEKHMGFFSKDIKTMDHLFVHTLRDIYYADIMRKNRLCNLCTR